MQLNCILLIDDNDDDNYLHTLAIRKAAAAKEVRTASSGEKAIQYFLNVKNNPDLFPYPDLVFLDINMPGMNGFEFIDKARQKQLLSDGPAVKIIMLTNSLNPDDEVKVKEIYADDILEFWNKPLTPDYLNRILGKYF